MDIRLIGVTKRFGDASAIGGIDLDIRSGELMALLGPSGSGKTTLLRVVAGLESPDDGRVMFGDEDATGIPVAERGVGFVFQHYALFRHLSVFDNVAYGLRVRRRERRSRAAIRSRVDELLHLVQLDGLASRYPSELSGGQRQRVALARALAVDPRVLLLDEPFGALDARVRRDLRRSLRRIHEATGQTTIFVTHDQAEALELADRIAILQGGRLEQVGTPDDILDRPASRFVLSFVGNGAQLPVTITAGAVLYRDWPLAISGEALREGPATLCLGPNDVALNRGQLGIPAIVLSARRQDGIGRAEIKLGGPDDHVLEVFGIHDQGLRRGMPVCVTITGGRLFPD